MAFLLQAMGNFKIEPKHLKNRIIAKEIQVQLVARYFFAGMDEYQQPGFNSDHVTSFLKTKKGGSKSASFSL